MSSLLHFDFFDFCLVRNPKYPLDKLSALSVYDSEELLHDKEFLNLIQNSSLTLFEEVRKAKEAKKESVMLSLRKYYVRMCSRCTPFELLSTYALAPFREGCSALQLSESCVCYSIDKKQLRTVLRELKTYDFYRYTSTYYANPTLIRIGESFQYLEYANEKNKYLLSRIDYHAVFKKILTLATQGITRTSFIQFLNKEFSMSEITDIFNFMVDSQALISAWECSVLHDETVEKIYQYIENYYEVVKDNTILSDFVDFYRVYRKFCNLKKEEDYRKMEEVLKNTYTKYITMEARRETVRGGVSNRLEGQVREALDFYLKVCHPLTAIKERLDAFKTEFVSKYGENRYIPFLEALNPRTGIEYPQGLSMKKGSELLEELVLPTIQNNKDARNFSFLEVLVASKMRENLREIEIFDSDLQRLEIKKIRFPKTIYIHSEIMKDAEGNEVVYIKGIGGRTAMEPLSRYEKNDAQIRSALSRIADYEAGEDKSCLMVDIPFYTGEKIDNIISHRTVRNKELFFQSRSTDKSSALLPASDVFITVKEGNLRLWSKKENKYILPVNPTVYNYEKSENVYYKFLSDYMMGLYEDVVWPLSPIFIHYDFIPRIRYKNFIFFPACWGLSAAEAEWLRSIRKTLNADDFICEVKEWRIKRNIPRRVLYNNLDLLLLIDFSIPGSVDLLFSVIKKTKKVWLYEFLYDSFRTVTTDEVGKEYTNEVFMFLKVSK